MLGRNEMCADPLRSPRLRGTIGADPRSTLEPYVRPAEARLRTRAYVVRAACAQGIGVVVHRNWTTLSGGSGDTKKAVDSRSLGKKRTSRSSWTAGRPRMRAQGEAHGERRGQRGRGSERPALCQLTGEALRVEMTVAWGARPHPSAAGVPTALCLVTERLPASRVGAASPPPPDSGAY